ncbi:MAG: hypothetical protein EOM64_08995, partial [Erysipelotrichia bacterium]|nr:hypothetical protein [Erysipelotrichia bacterium]
MTPFKTQIARNHIVPSPWIPVSVSGKEIRVLDRVYTFGKTALPSQIVSGKNKLFTSAPQFLLNGQAIQWNAAQIGENHGDYVEISASGKFTGGTAQINGKLWFDGMY